MNQVQKSIVLSGFAVSIVSTIFSLSFAEAAKWTYHVGNQLNDAEYSKRVAYCIFLKFEGEIETNLNCWNWVLTQEGEGKIADKAVSIAWSDDYASEQQVKEIEKKFVIPGLIDKKLQQFQQNNNLN